MLLPDGGLYQSQVLPCWMPSKARGQNIEKMKAGNVRGPLGFVGLRDAQTRLEVMTPLLGSEPAVQSSMTSKQPLRGWAP